MYFIIKKKIKCQDVKNLIFLVFMMLKAFTSLEKSVVDFLEYNYFRFLVDLNNIFHDKTVIELYFVFHFNFRFMFKT